jgi:hypothetical protein
MGMGIGTYFETHTYPYTYTKTWWFAVQLINPCAHHALIQNYVVKIVIDMPDSWDAIYDSYLFR